VYEGKASMIFGRLFVVYLIFKATTPVKPVSWNKRPLEIVLMLFSFFSAAYSYYNGSQVWQLPGHMYNACLRE
jgi:hypothetical protein